MRDHDEMIREFARSVAETLDEDYAAQECCECGNATLVMIGTVFRCDVCGNSQLPASKQMH